MKALDGRVLELTLGQSIEASVVELMPPSEILIRVGGLQDSPSARLLQLGADGLEFAVYFWIDDPQNGRQNVCSDVNLRILKALNAAGIEIPFAQRVLHVHNMTSFPAASAPPASPAPFTSSTKATTN